MQRPYLITISLPAPKWQFPSSYICNFPVHSLSWIVLPPGSVQCAFLNVWGTLNPMLSWAERQCPGKRTSMGRTINLFRDGSGGYSSNILWALLTCIWLCFDQSKRVIKPLLSFWVLTLWSCLITIPQLTLVFLVTKIWQCWCTQYLSSTL